MTFNSVEFLVFFPVVALLYALVFRHERRRDLLLLIASYAFYMGWNWRYAGLILFSTCVDYWVGARLASTPAMSKRRRLLLVSLILNLGLLGYFKYNNFFAESAGWLFHALGLPFETDRFLHTFLLPVGISFYTFQSLSYTIDLYRGRIEVERSWVKFALYVAFFPQLVAGPIVRAADFLPQLRGTPDVSDERVRSGLALMFRGLFKKIVFADLLAALGVDAVFSSPADYSSVTLLLALYGYSFQIYNDFSGYSDIAIGAARVLGFDLPENFRRPYMAQNVREFWTRWHISLSTWLRDYLYIPLGGGRGSPGRVVRNLMITMLLGGLWHGAALNFVLWGGWHGLLLVFARGVPKEYERASAAAISVRRFLCFHLIAVSWLLFRVDSVDQLAAYTTGLVALSTGFQLSWLFFLVLVTTATLHFVSSNWMDRVVVGFTRLPVAVQSATYACLIVLFAGLSFGGPSFIYFQF